MQKIVAQQITNVLFILFLRLIRLTQLPHVRQIFHRKNLVVERIEQ